MSALSRIRQNIGLIAIVIFIALAAFILTDFIRGITTIVQGVPEAGTVAGSTISNDEYQEQVSLYNQNSGGGDLAYCNLRNQVWTNLVREKVFQQELDKVGLQVTGEELYQMFAGETVSPLVRQLLGIQPGQEVTQVQMRRFLDQLTNESPEQLAQLEEIAARERGIERYNSMLAASYLGSDASARRENRRNNRSVNLSFLAIKYNTISDSAVSVSDGELREYLRENEEEFQQEEQSLVRFARFELTPTRRDSMKVYQGMASRRENFGATLNDSTFTIGRTRTPYRGVYRLPFALPEGIRDSVLAGEEKQVFGPVEENGYYKLYKLVSKTDTSTVSAKVRHILVTYDGDSTKALGEARQALSSARGDFAAAAAEFSDDPGTKASGGQLGWYRIGQFGPDFDEAVENASIGSVVGPVEGPGGYHVIKVEAKNSEAFALAQIEEEVIYTKETRDSVYGVANNFAAYLQNSQDINQTASELGFPAFQSAPLTKDACSVGGGLNGGRELVVWAVSADVGDVAKRIFTVGDNYVVAQLVSRTEEGVQPLEDVREIVAGRVRNEKKADLIRERLASYAGQDLNAMQTGYGEGAFVNSAQNISFSSPTIPNVGADPMVIGKAIALSQGETSDIIEGRDGIYVMQVTGVTEAEELDEASLEIQRNQAAQQGRFSLQSAINNALIEMSNIDDNRIAIERRQYNVN